MSYGISLHPREIKLAHQAGAELDEFKHAPIPEAVREAFIERLLRRQYELESTNATCKTFVHRKKEWPNGKRLQDRDFVFRALLGGRGKRNL
jgi:hypothetical protein